ncbi:MAG TPA: hypothetical protein VJJ81_03265 [Candidatus Babeliales bacterium]|nr:hypothetical protein [Candidatus Babeliales bacterium]
MKRSNNYRKRVLAVLGYGVGLMLVFLLSHNTPPNCYANFSHQELAAQE